MKIRKLVLMIVCSLFLIGGITGCRQDDGVPTNVEIGMEALESGNYANALTSFQTAIADGKNLVGAYRGEGMAYMSLGQYDQAVVSFEKAISETDEKKQDIIKDTQMYKAAALYKQNDFVGTISVCDDILVDSANGDAYYLRGVCYLEQGEAEKAKVDFDAAVSRQPQDYDLYLNIYESYREKKQSATGDEYLQEALKIESTEKEDAYQKARIYYYLENYEQAQAELTVLIGEQNEKALVLMGKIYQALGDYPHARNMYEQYITKYGETPEAYNGMALADIGEENYDNAIANIEKGLALDAENGKQKLYYNLIVAYEFKGDFKGARSKAVEYATRYPADEMGKKEYEFLESRE